MGTLYERELKGILQADRDILLRVTKTCTLEERDNYREIEEHPFMVVRAAGSFGMDLIAIRGDISFPIEEKSSSGPVIRFGSGRLGQQADWLKGECEKASVMPVYAYRQKGVKGDFWRIFTMEMEALTGIQGLVHRRLPTIPRTLAGNHIMRWEEGLPLNEFIHYISSIALGP